MAVTFFFLFSKLRTQTALWLGIGFLALVVIVPAHAATYRCHDESGDRVLTDNPVQLLDCTQLPTHIPSSIYGGVPPSQVQNVIKEPTLLPAPSNTSPTTQPDPVEDNPDKQPGREITVPLTKIGGSLVVQVMLNHERSAHLILDTGASMTVLSTNAAIDLGILGTTDNELMTVNTAGGSVQVNMNYLPSISVGTAQATNIAVVIHDLPDIPEQIEGLLGMSFLKHFLVTLDPEHARLILRPKRQHSSGTDSIQ